jgi:hypothetical protein
MTQWASVALTFEIFSSGRTDAALPVRPGSTQFASSLWMRHRIKDSDNLPVFGSILLTGEAAPSVPNRNRSSACLHSAAVSCRKLFLVAVSRLFLRDVLLKNFVGRMQP